MKESVFVVPKMDCPSEERVIRMALEPVDGLDGLRFDLGERTVRVQHHGSVDELLRRLEPLGFGARLERSADAVRELPPEDVAGERTVLRQLLAINGVMFVAELGFGLWAQSTGLIADALDMLADAMVYGSSLYAVGRTMVGQRRAARASGLLQMLLAVGLLVEVARRAVGGSEPIEALMIGVAAIAFIANLACVALLARHRNGGVHLQASWIFSTNDLLANLGVVLGGILVWITGSAAPDLVVGTAIGLLVLSGAVRIRRLARD